MCLSFFGDRVEELQVLRGVEVDDVEPRALLGALDRDGELAGERLEDVRLPVLRALALRVRVAPFRHGASLKPCFLFSVCLEPFGYT